MPAPYTRNTRFIYNGGDFRITLLCGDTPDGTTYYLPEDMLIYENSSKITGQYTDNLPIGVPEAYTIKLKIDTRSFTEEMEDLGLWIRKNRYSISGLDGWIQNVWIFERQNGDYWITDFIGVQQSVNEETHDLREQEYEIELFSLHKVAMERVKFAPYQTAGKYGTGAILDRKINEYFAVSSGIKYEQYFTITDWMWTRAQPLSDVLTYYFNQVRNVVRAYMRNEDAIFSLNFHNMPQFYKRALDSIAPFVEANDKKLTIHNVNIITEIWRHKHNDITEHPLVFPDEFVGGIIKKWADKYNNMWNFCIAMAEGMGYTFRLDCSGNGFNGYNTEFHSLIATDGVATINIADLIEMTDGETYKEAKNAFTAVSNRLLTTKDGNIAIVTEAIDNTSQSKKTYEVEMPFNIEPAVTNSYKGNANTNHVRTKFDYDKNSIASMPTTELFYFPGADAEYEFTADTMIKVADYCEFDNGVVVENDGRFPVQIVGLDEVNENINYLQANSYARKLAKIIKSVIAEHQQWLTISLPISKANLNSLGGRYELNLSRLLTPNYFYGAINIPTCGILVNVEMDYINKVSKCIFFLREDEWA